MKWAGLFYKGIALITQSDELDILMLKRLLFLVSVPLFLLLLGSFWGAFHPLGDSLAVFRGPLAGASAVAVLLMWRGARSLATLAAVLVLWASYTVLAPRFSDLNAQMAPYTFYQKNMLFMMSSTGPLRDDILAQAPDFVALQEVSRRNQPILASLVSQYPAQVFCPFAAVGGVAVASRWPLIAGSERCEASSGMAAMQVETEGGPVWVVSLHLHWPFPMGQAAQVRRLVVALAALDGVVVLGGDFNMVPWSHSMRVITAATNTRRIGVPQYTLPLKGLYTLPIDHVLINNNAKPAASSKRPLFGSDHFGVLARFHIR